MTTDKTGGPAYPVKVWCSTCGGGKVAECHRCWGRGYNLQPGMTWLDKAAMEAMQAILSANPIMCDCQGKHEELSQLAYAVAEQMLAEKRRIEGETDD